MIDIKEEPIFETDDMISENLLQEERGFEESKIRLEDASGDCQEQEQETGWSLKSSGLICKTYLILLRITRHGAFRF